MAISEDKTLIQVIITKNTDEFLNRYCQLFGISKSQFCNFAICEKILNLFDKEVPYEKKTSQN